MTSLRFQPRNRGALYRPPTMRLYHYRSVSSREAGECGPSWLNANALIDWRPLRLNWACNGSPSELTIQAPVGLPPGAASRVHAEDPAFAEGDMVTLVQVGSGGSLLGDEDIEWFRGYVVRQHIQIGPDNESLVITAHGPESRLRGKSVRGTWHKNAAADSSESEGNLTSTQAVRSNVFSSDLPVIFNESGLPNASASQWQLADASGSPSDRECRVFESPGRRVQSDDDVTISAVWWTAYDALRSLVEYHDNYDVISPNTSWAQIHSLLEGITIARVDVDGMNLLDAIDAVLRPGGFGFALEPWAVSNGRDQSGKARHRLVVFSRRNPPITKLPRLASDLWGEVTVDSDAGRQAEVQRLGFLRDASDIHNDVTVLGNQKRVQIVLEFNGNSQSQDLHPLWDAQIHSLDSWADDNVIDPWNWTGSGSYNFEAFATRYNRGGGDHWCYRHVFRSFAWNEDSALSPVISETPDLSDYGIGDEGLYVRRPRPLASTLTYDSDGQRARLHPRRVQLGIAGYDDSWIDVPADIWNDRAGFTLSVDKLAGNAAGGQWYPYASHPQHAEDYGKLHYLTLLHNALRDGGEHKLVLRVVGSIECDQAVSATAQRAAESPWPFKASRTIRFPGRYQWREVEDQPFSEQSPCATADDRGDASSLAQRIRDVEQQCTGHGSMVLRYLTRSYVIGDGISGTSGRSLSLHVGVSAAHGSNPVIVGVVWNFEEGACKTELLLDSPRLRVTE